MQKSEVTLLRDKDWSLVDGEICKIIAFTPLASIKNGTILKIDHSTPYASITLECKKVPDTIKGFITHKDDFENLWKIFKERGVSSREEVLVVWSTKHYKFKFLRSFSPFFPKLRVMVFPKEAFKLINNPNLEPKLTGEARAKATLPILDLKPKIMA